MSTSSTCSQGRSQPWDQVIVASNRGPVEYHQRQDGRLTAARGSGGVVTALASIAKILPLDWIAAPITEADRKIASGQVERPSGPLAETFVDISARTYRKYYEGFANGLLWFLQHYMLDTPREPRIDAKMYDAWNTGYIPANQAFARAIAGCAGGAQNPLVLVEDYHLYLVPAEVRARCSNAVVQHFCHIPWPETRYWQLIPDVMRGAIHRGLLGADILGFQIRRDVKNFLDCCSAFVPEAEVDRAANRIQYQGRQISVRSYPISVDPPSLRHLAASAEVRRSRERLERLTGEKTIVRVDRLEPSKNILRGFDALDDLLHRRPDLVGKVRMLAFLVPSREAMPVYRQYREDVFARIFQINDKYRRGEYVPVTYFYENNYRQAIAAMTLYDVLLVNPVIDGMNLVAKEGPLVNRKDGVEVLSEGAGAYDQIGEWALSVAPADILGTSLALEQAIDMAPEERARRANAMREEIEREDINWWLERQLADLEAFSTSRRTPLRSAA